MAKMYTSYLQMRENAKLPISQLYVTFLYSIFLGKKLTNSEYSIQVCRFKTLLLSRSSEVSACWCLSITTDFFLFIPAHKNPDVDLWSLGVEIVQLGCTQCTFQMFGFKCYSGKYISELQTQSVGVSGCKRLNFSSLLNSIITKGP